MQESESVPPAFFSGRTLKTLNNTLWRFSRGTRSDDETLAALSSFLREHEVEKRGGIDWEVEASAVHGLLANGSPAARKAFAAIEDGRYVSRFKPDSEERIELYFKCDRQSMLIEVEERTYFNDVRGKTIVEPSDKTPPGIRKGYGFLTTGQLLLHIFLTGAHTRDRIHYIEANTFASTGHPRLVRFGGENVARGEPGSPLSSFLWGIHHFTSEQLEIKEKELYSRPAGDLDNRQISEFSGSSPRLIWGTTPHTNEDEEASMGLQFIDAVRANNLPLVKRLLEEDIYYNYQDEEGMTALHHAAALGRRGILRCLIASDKCDYLAADYHGRFPSDLSIEWSRDYAMARLLARKRMEQAFKERVPCRVP